MDDLEVIDNNNSQSRYYQKKKLPNAIAVLVLGIISIVICYLGVITGTIALALASKDMKEYRANPDRFDEGSYKNLNAGRICAIIGVSLSALVILFYAVIFITAFNTASKLKDFSDDNFESMEKYMEELEEREYQEDNSDDVNYDDIEESEN